MLANARVLIADDDPDVLQSVAEEFEQWGSRVTVVPNGSELMRRLADPEPYDLVVTDISMPLSNGLHAAHSARYVGVDTPVIVMTGLRDRQLDERARALGPNVTLLRKPFTSEQLEEAATLLLQRGEGEASPPP